VTLYAAAPWRRARQLAADVSVLLWAWLCVAAGAAVHGAVDALAVPAERLRDGAGGLADQLRGAGGTAGEVPFVGDDLRRPLDQAGGSADELAGAGAAMARSAHELADLLGLVVAVLPILLALALWLPVRIRFAVRARRARQLATRPGSTDLLALRALTRRPLGELSRISADPLGDWRRGEPRVVRRLAALELRSAGVSAPSSAD
jgi:hypothetical protein